MHRIDARGRARVSWLLSLGTTLALLGGCGGGGGGDADADAAVVTDAGPARDAATPDGDASACTPRECGVGECGVFPDGCGDTLDCGVCACTPSTFAEDCPSRPCETAAGCDDGTCRYEPITCDFERCECPADGCAADTDPRACGAGCATTVCDPRPSDVAGRTVYANACVPREEVACGLCALGGYACGTGDALECVSPDYAWIDPATAECSGGSALSTIVFVDALVEGTADGSREHPFRSVADGIAAAIVRSARVVVIGRSLETLGTQSVPSGISLLGGYTGWPAWIRDDTQRPVFHARASDVSSGRLVGMIAEGIHEPTRIEHVRVVTDDLTGTTGASNAGIFVQDSPMLELVDVVLEVGAAEQGATGASAGMPVVGGASAGTGGAGYHGASTAACGARVSGGASGTRTCDGIDQPAALGGVGAAPAGTDPVDGTDHCGLSTLACYFKIGSDAPTGAMGRRSARRSTGGVDQGPGEDGAAHTTTASSGPQGTPAITVVDGFPMPTGVGGPGVRGTAGRGGGGGSSGQVSRTPGAGTVTSCTPGGGGGGGGAGGCGGRPGAGGAPGGWNYGLVVSTSTGVVIDDVVVMLASPGAGGAGGAGSQGTPGGAGGTAGAPPPSTSDALLWGGSRGGNGAEGQRGGLGGLGAEGVSVGIFCDSAIDVAGVSATGVTSVTDSQGCS